MHSSACGPPCAQCAHPASPHCLKRCRTGGLHCIASDAAAAATPPLPPLPLPPLPLPPLVLLPLVLPLPVAAVATTADSTSRWRYFHPLLHREAHDGPLTFDLGNLTAWDASAPDASAFEGGAGATNAACHHLAQTIFQSLAARLFALPSEAAPVGRLATLPPPSTVLPREKPIPKPRPPTKWEVFAQKKGIEKRKRSKLEWDEASGEWKRRYGYKRANDEAAVPVIEARADDVVSGAGVCRGLPGRVERSMGIVWQRGGAAA